MKFILNYRTELSIFLLVPIHALRWYRLERWGGTDSSAIAVPIHALWWYRFADTINYTIAILQQSLFYIHADYQYITIFIKQRIQLYYNNLHTIIWYRLICNICKSGCHSTIQHKNFQYWIFKFRQMTKYQALHSHDIQLCIHVCHKQTDIYIFHQANMTLFYSYKWAWGHNPL